MNDSSLSTMFKITFSALFRLLRFLVFFIDCSQAKKKKTLVSENASNEKNLHMGGRKFICF